MKDTAHQKFDISVNIDSNGNKTFELQVQPEETTDGVPYFVCKTNGVEISQLRKNEDNEWEQLWGDLNEETVQSIGKAIEEYD